MKYTITVESDNFEEDTKKLVDTFMSAFREYSEIERANTKARAEVTTNSAEAKIHGLDNRIDGIEARLKTVEDFREVVSEDSAPSTKKK